MASSGTAKSDYLVLLAAQLLERLLGEVQRGSRVRLEVGTGAITLDGIAPLRDLPLEFDFRLRSSLGQIDLDAVAGGFYVTDIH